MNIYELNNDKFDFINKLEGHKDALLKVINIENKLISCSRDTTMIIWEKKDKNYNNIKSIIIGYSYDNSNIIQINENKLVSSSTDYITFFDIKNNFNEIKKIEDISSNSYCNSMTMFNENILIIGGMDFGIYLIDTNNYQVISKPLQNNTIYSIIKLTNGNILVGDSSSSLIEYKYDNNNFIEIKSKSIEELDIITGLIEINDEVIISYSCDSFKLLAF